jgi:signal transduction histidine kinase
MREKRDYQKFLIRNGLMISPKLFYASVGLISAIISASFVSMFTDLHMPTVFNDLGILTGIIVVIILQRTRKISTNVAIACLAYIVVGGQNIVLLNAMLFNPDAYLSLLMWTALADLFLIFISGFILPINVTIIFSIILSTILGLAGWNQPNPEHQYMGYALPIVMAPFTFFFLMYRRYIEALIDSILNARSKLKDKNRLLREAQTYLVTQEKLSALGSLATGIAHEINNPMRFIANYNDLNQELLDETYALIEQSFTPTTVEAQSQFQELKESVMHNVAVMGEQGARVVGIIQSMQSHARSRSTETEVVDVSDVIVSAIRHHGEHPDTSIYFQRPDHPIQAGIVVGDFERVILNLLDNARYSVKEKTARDPGHQGKIDLTLAGDDEAVEISITDNGVGIAEQNLPMLGTPFYTTKPPGKGTGLGLSICHDIIDTIHQGSISIASQQGEFARVTIRVPRNLSQSP